MSLDVYYKTGVLWQDLQHKELIDLFNKLSDQNQKADSSSFTHTIGFLVMYANQHLSLEEGYMDEYEYPDAEYHKKAHKEFIRKLKSFRKDHNSFSHDAIENLLKDIKEWIINHILENDKKFGSFVLAKEEQNFFKNKWSTSNEV
nr:hemerythrin family protein [uncultured Desulfobacter sp.]